MTDYFKKMAGISRQHASQIVQEYRDRQAEPAVVWLLWGDQSVLGVYRTEAAAIENLALVPDSLYARIEKRVVGS